MKISLVIPFSFFLVALTIRMLYHSKILTGGAYRFLNFVHQCSYMAILVTEHANWSNHCVTFFLSDPFAFESLTWFRCSFRSSAWSETSWNKIGKSYGKSSHWVVCRSMVLNKKCQVKEYDTEAERTFVTRLPSSDDASGLEMRMMNSSILYTAISGFNLTTLCTSDKCFRSV